MAKEKLCSCLPEEDWLVINAALIEVEENVDKLRKRVARTFLAIPGALEAKKALVVELDNMDTRVKNTISRLADTPKCGKTPEEKEISTPKSTKAEKKTAKK